MKKIAIAGNHSFPQVGGSERVIQQISESLCADYLHEVTVFSQSVNKDQIHNKVSYRKLPSSGNHFVELLSKEKFDHLLVYSDLFYHWLSVLDSAHKTSFEKSIVLVGANAILANPVIQRKFREKHRFFNVITHSDNYQDYKACNDWGIPVTVIPNGVDLNEFNLIPPNDFRDKFNVKSKNLLLCVSNFFPGKGYEFLHGILQQLNQLNNSSYEDGWELVIISSDLPYPFCKIIEESVKKKLSNFPVKFLKSISRQDTVNAFRASSVFIFPSQKEVAPLVILEAMAACTPWVALPVGNTPVLKGGFTIPYIAKDRTGNMLYGPDSFYWFGRRISSLLTDTQLRSDMGAEGRRAIEHDYDWKIISSHYNKIFSSKKE